MPAGQHSALYVKIPTLMEKFSKSCHAGTIFINHALMSGKSGAIRLSLTRSYKLPLTGSRGTKRAHSALKKSRLPLKQVVILRQRGEDGFLLIRILMDYMSIITSFQMIRKFSQVSWPI
jgi:hypothetical protein